MGFLQRGQMRMPASNLTAELGGPALLINAVSATGSEPGKVVSKEVVFSPGLSVRRELARWGAAHSSRAARSFASISSVRASGSPGIDFRPGFDGCQASSGTGTTRPQSGRLPAAGRPLMGTLSRRPQGQ